MASKIKCMQTIYSIIFCLFIFSNLNAQTEKEVIIIGNNTAIKEISLKDAKDVFKGKRVFWKNNEEVIVVLPSPKFEGVENVSNLIFQSSVTAMQKYWLGLVFQGRANPPVFVKNVTEAIEYVNKNSGSIAVLYCEMSELPSTLLIKLNK